MEELEARVDELSRSCRRLVAAADAERQRIERALHDGTQQQLIALCVNLQLARHLLRTDSQAAEALLEAMHADAHDALEALRDLAHAVYPPLLAERGALDALRSVAAELEGRISVSGSVDRLQPAIEGALYFTCAEALRRLAEEPGHGQAIVRAWQEPGEVHFEVTDEAGRDPAWCDATVTAVGDRISALGGSLAAATTPAGAQLRGRIPLSPAPAAALRPGT